MKTRMKLTQSDMELIDTVMHSARKAGARIERKVSGRLVQFVWHGPDGEVTPGEMSADPQHALATACKKLWEERP